MPRKLTPASSLHTMKKEAKRWLKALRANDPQARSRFQRAVADAPADPGLRDVQHALAREYGFDGWSALQARLDEGVPAGVQSELVERFLKSAAIDFRVGGSLRISVGRTADRILRRHPDIAKDSIFTAVVCGDVEEVARILAERPEAASEKGGPREWDPLLYLCWTRLEHPPAADNAVAIARLLLDHGADPNTYQVGGNEKIHYTALTSSAGEGEEDAPPHPRREELWKLLLERGAEPYDMQTLYNTHFRGDMLWYLELMYARAMQLGRRADWADPEWPMLGMGGYGQGARFLLGQAVQKNDMALAEWCLARGASANPAVSSHPKAPKHTLVEEALRLGHTDIAGLLVRHGAPPFPFVRQGIEAYAAACFGLDRAAATNLLAEHPEYLGDPRPLFAAAKRDRADVVAFLLDLGTPIEVEDQHGTRALHEAAYGDAPNAVSLLLARGAQVDPRERFHGNTPLGHAVYGKRHRVIALLAPVSRDIWELTWTGALERVKELLSAEPALARAYGDGHTPLMWLPDDDAKAMEITKLFLANGADPSLKNKEGQTAADRARERGMDEIADLLDAAASPSTARLLQFEQLAKDILAGYHGDTEALQRLVTHFGVSYNTAQLRERVQSHLNDARGIPGEPTLADVQLILARQYAFDSWAALVEGIVRPSPKAADARLGLSSSPPFYRINENSRTIEPRPPLSDQDWDTVFAVMRERGLTGISSGAMTDAAMERLTRLDFVTRVNVGGARALTDDGLLHLARMPQLEELDVSGWHSPLTDRGLEVLRHLEKLRKFSMCWPQRVSDAGAANLTFCDDLEDVNVMGTPTGDGTVNALRGKRNLRNLKTGKLLTDAGIPLLHDLPVFKTWQGGEVKYGLMSFEGEPNNLMIDGPFTDRGLAGLAGLDGLFGLGFFWHSHAFTSDGLASLEALPNLGFLGCQGENCNDAAMRRIAELPKLRMLMAQGTVASDGGFAALSRSQTLEHLWGRECPNLTGRGFAAMAALPVLKGLAVSCKHVDDTSLSALPRFPMLRFLMPMDVPDNGFRHVGRCEKLERLWCMYCRDTGDEATAHLADLKLKLYYAGKTKITDRSLEIIGRMMSLEKLEFWEVAGITDAGVAALTRLPRLREISIDSSPRVTRQGLAAFPAHVKINYGT